MNRYTKIALALCLFPMVAWAEDAEEKAPASPVMVESAQRDTFSATLWVSGTVISQNDARIAAETDGRITWVADVGSRIEQGEAIARIDAEDLRLDLADSEAQLLSLKSQLKYRDSSLQRFQKLADSNNAAATQLDEAQSQLDMTRQEIKRAEVAIAQIKRRIRQTEVLAPFPGIVVERVVQIGEFVNRGAQVARLVDTEHREIRAQAPLSVAGWIREGMQVSVEHGNRESLSPVSYVIPVGDDRSRMFEVRIAANDPAWIIGSPVRIALPNSEPRELVAIPRDGLVLRGSNIYVMRVNSDNTVEKITVETGIGLGGFVEVIGNVEQGDRIITRGGERIKAGQAVTIAEG
ncbi:MAG: efflux RND transporter periplasmic adaptor subunit [Xanthomonadales bacterium]|nr:efflux RND transporter periplasmic adaptor subunit [Xanthomonadales bacterium]MDH4018548.1 efflux RND transporter periplasmic adaptor subunit [Xanthomonadales bacterium]